MTRRNADAAGLSLVGFVGDVRGSERQLLTVLPVLAAGAELRVPNSFEWAGDDPTRMSDVEADFAHLFSTQTALSLHDGDLVWLVGDALIADIANQPELARLEAILRLWPGRHRNFAWRVGSRNQFEEFMVQWTNEIVPVLRRALVSRRKIASGETEELFKLYLAWNSRDESERMLIRALYFDEMNDETRKRAVFRQAAASPHFASADAFRRDYELYREGVRRQRLRDLDLQGGRAFADSGDSWIPSVTPAVSGSWRTRNPPFRSGQRPTGRSYADGGRRGR